MKNKRLKKNIITSFLLQVITLICGFILPGLILNVYGSIYNGIVNSVNQFLSCITLLRAGVGGATRAALYKSLANDDNNKTSEIINATESFMRKIAILFVAFLLLFACGYPFLVKNSFDWFFSFSLVIILGLSTIAQYYFGITYQFLLQADQKQYIYNYLQIIAIIINTVFTIILINFGLDIRIVKLVSAFSFGMVPIALYYYVKKNYKIDKKVKYTSDTLKGRWDAFAHQVASFIHSNTDIMVLTVMSDLYNVSIYSVYNLVVSGIKQLICTCSNSIEAMIGESIAKKNYEKLRNDIKKYEWWINTLSLLFFGCTCSLIVSFVLIYTTGVNDADYNQPLFAYFLCFATYLSCIRLPYQSVVEAAGHFKQTKKGAIIEAFINVLISIFFVRKYGCIGVALGTCAAMLYRTIDYGLYASKNILQRSNSYLYKRMIISILSFCLIILINYIFLGKVVNDISNNYFKWFICGVIIFSIQLILVLIIDIMFYYKETKDVISNIKKKVRI